MGGIKDMKILIGGQPAVILGDLYSPIISWDFLFSSSPVSAHDDVSGSKVVSRGCVVTFWTSNGADKVDFCHLKSP